MPDQLAAAVRRLALAALLPYILYINKCCKSNAAFGGCGFFVGARRQSASFRGVCVTYGKALLLAVSQPSSYGKMVPLRHPMVNHTPLKVATIAR